MLKKISVIPLMIAIGLSTVACMNAQEDVKTLESLEKTSEERTAEKDLSNDTTGESEETSSSADDYSNPASLENPNSVVYSDGNVIEIPHDGGGTDGNIGQTSPGHSGQEPYIRDKPEIIIEPAPPEIKPEKGIARPAVEPISPDRIMH